MEVGQILSLDEMREAVGIKKGAEVPPAKRRALVTRLAHRMMSAGRLSWAAFQSARASS